MGQPNVQSVESKETQAEVKEVENTSAVAGEVMFEEFDLDDIEVIESKVFA
ncbi:3-thiaglutamate biosynthesis pearlin carrier peptide TglA [Pseudomonas capsici]|uniref:3-thiaglutamate biosynthesis pearlin carrier peptide TglA n=1 Tax=Pseudomonas capsici TaxID=2810614 RepID=UPI0013C341CD|nr:TglA family RiPP precursor [Pseudomonas capsici]MCV4341497.1 TglA family RiPP precursor [Pseudomonas capsici]